MTVSFVVLSYNQAAYIAEAVTAALAQEGQPLEIILSDDCSTDGTFGIMQDIAAAYRGPHRVTVRRNETNLGLIRHFEKVFALCEADVMIVAWGDDVSMPDRAVQIRAAFETTEAWLVHSHANCVDLEGRELPPHYLSADLVRGADLTTLAVSGGLFLGATGAYHRRLLQTYGPISNPRAYEDLVYGFRAALEARVHFIEQPLVTYRIGSGISTNHLLFDAEGKRRAEVRRLRTQLAVLAQRRRDARRFGLSNEHLVLQGIRKHRLLALFQLYYWGSISRARVFRLMFAHPIRALRARKKVKRFSAGLARLA